MDRVRNQTERLLNLLIALRSARGWVDRATLRRSITDYREQSDNAAFDRMFSRDKDLLRRLGIEISTTDWTDFDTGETAYGYRITEADYALPQIVLTPEESAVLSVAQTVFTGTDLAPDTFRAVNKLRGLGLDLTAPDEREVPPARIGSKLFGVFVNALGDRQPVEFNYRRSGGVVTRRRFEPYAMLTRGDRVYAVGRDIDRDAVRTFRLSRITGSVRPIRSRAAGDYSIPTGFRAGDFLQAQRAEETAQSAVVEVDPGRADPLRRAAAHLGTRDGVDVFEVDFDDTDQFLAWLMSFAPGVVPVEPPELVQQWRVHAERTAVHLKSIAQEGPQNG